MLKTHEDIKKAYEDATSVIPFFVFEIFRPQAEYSEVRWHSLDMCIGCTAEAACTERGGALSGASSEARSMGVVSEAMAVRARRSACAIRAPALAPLPAPALTLAPTPGSPARRHLLVARQHLRVATVGFVRLGAREELTVFVLPQTSHAVLGVATRMWLTLDLTRRFGTLASIPHPASHRIILARN